MSEFKLPRNKAEILTRVMNDMKVPLSHSLPLIYKLSTGEDISEQCKDFPVVCLTFLYEGNLVNHPVKSRVINRLGFNPFPEQSHHNLKH